MHMSKRRLVIGGVICGLVIVSGSAWVALRGSSGEIDSARLATVERGDVAKSVVATGRVEPITKVEIKSKANGIVKELKVDVGDRVAAGQVLVELDKDNLAARLREARAALAGAQARGDGRRGGVREEQGRGRGARRAVRPAQPRARGEAVRRPAGAAAGAGRRPQRPRDGGEPPAGGEDAARRRPGEDRPRRARRSRRRRRPSTAPRRS